MPTNTEALENQVLVLLRLEVGQRLWIRPPYGRSGTRAEAHRVVDVGRKWARLDHGRYRVHVQPVRPGVYALMDDGRFAMTDEGLLEARHVQDTHRLRDRIRVAIMDWKGDRDALAVAARVLGLDVPELTTLDEVLAAHGVGPNPVARGAPLQVRIDSCVSCGGPRVSGAPCDRCGEGGAR